jgi:zinc protease
MKKLLMILILGLLWCNLSFANIDDLDEKLTLNKEIIYGKLDNNFTYYIKQNIKPKKKATIHLILKAGSLMEDDDQLGLAHLIEHMVFNGTKSYPKNEIDDYLNSIGLQIGSDYNAATGFEATIYKMEIPTDDISKIEKGLHILSEMVGYATLDDSSFEKEKKIVEEEWRSDLGKSKRLYEEYKKYLYKDSRFLVRQPIGDIEIIKNFSHDVARRFYDDWYRPDLMGIIAVGDFDPSYVKKIVEKYFSKLENKNNRPVPNTLLPKYNDTIFLNQSDEEQASILFIIRNKNKKLVLDTAKNLREKLIYDLIIKIVNYRFDSLNEKRKMDYDFALVNKGIITSKTDIFMIGGFLKENRIKEGLESILIELERIRQNGFLEKELELYKKKIISFNEQRLESKKTRENNSHVSEISRNFLEDEFVVGEEREAELDKKLLKTINVSDLNEAFNKWFKYDDRIVNFRYPKKIDNKITKDVFLSIENQIKNIKLAQYEFILDDKPLIEKELIGSKIISEKKHSSINTVELNLENGVKIYLKPTKNEINSFEFEAQSLGGFSHASLEDYHSAKSAEDLINDWIGFGSFSRSEIRNKIDEETYLKISLSRFYEGLEGSAKTDKAEELFKLIYLRFTPLKIDEVVFQNFISFLEEEKRNENLKYEKKFNRKVVEELCKNRPRCKTTEFKDISKIKIKKIKDFYDDRFADSSDFVFTFVGDFEIEDMKPYIQKYLGSLPNINRKESYIDNNIILNGRSIFEVKKNTENNASVSYVFSSKYTNLAQNRATIYLADIILNRLLDEEIREKQKLAYSIGSFKSLYSLPKPNHLMFIYFDCDPKNVKLIFSKIDEILLKIKKGDFDDKYLTDSKEKEFNDLKEAKQSNSFWATNINMYIFNKEGFKKLKNFDQIVKSINKKDIVNYFNKTFKENFVKGSFLPK